MACFTISKYILFFFNLLLWLAGLVLLGLGIWLEVDDGVASSVEIAGISFYNSGGILLLVSGSVIFVFGFLGCCGAIKENACLLGLYFTLILIVFAFEVAIGIYAFVSDTSLNDEITKALGELDLSNENGTDAESLISTQKNLQCCGTTNGCQDWNNSTKGLDGCECTKPSSQNTTACEAPPVECSGATVDSIYVEACDQAVYEFIQNNMIIIGSIAFAIALIEILGMIITIGLCCAITERNKVHNVGD